MGKLFLKLILISISFVIIDYIIGLGLDIIRNNSSDGRYYKAQYSLERCKADIVIFGASRAEVNIVPSIFEDSMKMICWNTGRGGQSLPFWLCMEKGILIRYTPKIAVIDIEPEFLSFDLSYFYEPVGFLRPFYRSHKEIRFILNNISLFEHFFVYSSLYTYNSSYYYLIRPYLFKNLDGKNTDKGWKPLIGQMTLSTPKPISINTFRKLNNETILLFNEFISNLSTKGCKVFVVISPRYNENVRNTSTIEYIKNMKNAFLCDFEDNKLFIENGRFYRDPDHLNVEGAIKFSNLLVNKIRKLNDK